jgi:hypothetical protein
MNNEKIKHRIIKGVYISVNKFIIRFFKLLSVKVNIKISIPINNIYVNEY